jgi:nitroreductase
METLKAINNRKSVRSYTGVLTDEALKTVLQAGEESPIGMGKYQSVHMTVIQNKGLLDEIDKTAGEFFGDPSRHPLYGAPCFILISVEEPAGNVQYSNAAMMVENMSLAATDIGIGNCAIWGAVAGLNANPELVAKLNLPEGFVACCGVVIGETEETYADRDIPSDRIAVSYIK